LTKKKSEIEVKEENSINKSVKGSQPSSEKQSSSNISRKNTIAREQTPIERVKRAKLFPNVAPIVREYVMQNSEVV